MDAQFDLLDLQKAANQIMVRNKLRTSGISGIIFGILAISGAWGMPTLSDTILMAIGLFLLVEGIWVLVSPSPSGILANSVAIASVGLWNIFGSITGSSFSGWPILGILQLQWAYSRYKQYKMFSNIATQAPTPEAMKFMNNIVNDIETRVVNCCDDLIEIRMNNVPYKVLLMERSAIFVSPDAKVVLVQNKHDMDIINDSELQDGKAIRISGEVLGEAGATISPEHFARYEAWREGSDRPSTINILRRSLKTRTRVLAGILKTFFTFALIIVAFGVISQIFSPTRASGGKYFAIAITLLAILGVSSLLWRGILRKKEWAWWTLVVFFSASSTWGIWRLFRNTIRMINHPEVYDNLLRLSNTVILLLILVIPLILLITDKPAGWNKYETRSTSPIAAE